MQAEALSGSQLGRYEIQSLLEPGESGPRYRAVDAQDGRQVVIQVVDPGLLGDPRDLEALKALLQAVARLEHPQWIPLLDFGEAQGYHYAVTPEVKGSILRNLLNDLAENGQWIVFEEALELVRLVGLAVDYAQRQGVLHREVDPAHLLLVAGSQGNLPYRPLLTDLGLGRLRDTVLETTPGSSVRTPAYISPEQALGAELDVRSDVYSLGVLLYELLTGRPPYPLGSVAQVVAHFDRDAPPQPPSPLEVRPQVPESVAQVALKALQASPERRYATPAEMVEALARATPQDQAEEAGAAVSLMTHVTDERQTIASPPGIELAQEAGHGVQARIVVTTPPEVAGEQPLTEAGITIGRGKENDLVLPFANISGRHARVEFEAGKARIVDLGSTNGTFLGTRRIPPNQAQAWNPDVRLRMGDVWIQLDLPETHSPAATVVGGPETRIDVSPFETRVSEERPPDPPATQRPPDEPPMQAERILLSLIHHQAEVAAGGRVQIAIMLFNQGLLVDHFEVQVEGLPATWIEPVAPIALMPGEERTVSVTFKPPHSPEARAGSYPILIRVVSRDDPSQRAQEETQLMIKPYQAFRAQVRPPRLRAGGRGRVEVENQGNATEHFEVQWRDTLGELKFDPEQAEVQVEPGVTEEQRFRPRMVRRRWLGGQEEHPYTVRVRNSSGEVEVLSAMAMSRGSLGTLLLLLFLLACVGLAALGFAFGPDLANRLALGTSLSEEQAAQATIEAFGQTATALWLANPTATLAPTGTTPPEQATATPAPGSPYRPIEGCPISRIRVGNWTRVSTDPPLANRVRSDPGLSGTEIIGQAEPGAVLMVLDGPECQDEMLWWFVRLDDGSDLEGWTAEGPNGEWLDPGSEERP